MSWLATPKFLIAAALGVIMCGQVLWWRRRDNILGFVLVATWAVTILVPLFGTSVVDQFNHQVVWRVTWMLLVGAGAYLVGLALGAGVGERSRVGRGAIWTHPFEGEMADLIRTWARRFAVASVALFAAAFALLGYVPALAADRQLAKYGVGPYAAGAARGGNVYHLALALGSVALPLMLVVTWKRPSVRDTALCAAVFVGLLLTLSREDAFSGPLLVVVAILIERRWKPVAVLSVVCVSLAFGTLVNELVFPGAPGQATPSLATRIAASAPDVHDQLAFMSGFQTLGNVFVGTKNLTSVLTPKKGYYDPAQYSVRTETLLADASAVGTGGIRLPAPEWGYVAFAWAGVVIWCLLSGLFAGWGTVRVRTLMDGLAYRSGSAVNYVLAWVFFNGTFGLLQGFFFPERAQIVLLMAAIVISCAGMTVRRQRRRAAASRAFWAAP